MTAHQTPASQPLRLRVVPPPQAPSVPSTDPAVPPSASPASPNEPAVAPSIPLETKGDRRKWFLIVGIVALTAASFIPVPYRVGGAVQLDWKESARQSVHTPLPAIVDAVLVETGDTVQPGQILAQLSSPQLEQEIAEVQENLSRAYQELESAQQSQIRAQAALLEATTRAQASQVQATRSADRLVQSQQGQLTPELQTLSIERQRLEGQLIEVNAQVERYQSLYEQGAISLTNLETYQIQYRNLERDLATTDERIRLAQQQLADTAVDAAAAANSETASVMAADQIAAAADQFTAHQQTIATLSNRLQELKARQAQLTLRATVAGTIITDDLDLKVGQELRPDTVLMQIANLQQLTANVEVREEDLDYVENNAPVTFRPRQAKLETYDARVEDVLYNVQPDDTQQRRIATVQVVIDNSDGRLRPGSSGYARIFSEWIPLYERIGRELIKLVPERLL